MIRFFGFVSAVLMAASLGPRPAEAADLFAAGGSLFRYDTSAGVLAEGSVKLDSQATDLEVDPRNGTVVVATSWGVRMFTPALAPVDSVALGVIDAIEIDRGTGKIYALVHPGPSRKETRGRHRLVVIWPTTPVVVLDVVEIGPLSFDLFLSPSGRQAVITNNVGREIDLVDLEAKTVSQRHFPDPTTQQAVVLRAALWRDDSRQLLLAESGRGLPLVVWALDVAGDAPVRHPLPWLHSGLTLASAGSDLLINGRDALMRVDAETLEPKSTFPLYRDVTDIAASGTDVYLVAPSEDGARILRLDGESAKEVISLPDRASVLALAPSAAP